MAITVSAPDAFFDGEPWAFTLTINQSDGTTPLDLTGSRLFVRFFPEGNANPAGICDSSAGDGSLTIAQGTGGVASFFVTGAGRPAVAIAGTSFGFSVPKMVTGDLYRLPPQGTPKDWKAVCRIQFPVIPSTGLPSS